MCTSFNVKKKKKGSDDGTVRVWEIETGREFWRHSFGTTSHVESVRFNPLIYKPLLMVVVKHRCILITLSFITNCFVNNESIYLKQIVTFFYCCLFQILTIDLLFLTCFINHKNRNFNFQITKNRYIFIL
ncbi:hypothetical protein RFI_34096 [Reticulomyxa filosa]|uniref:Uncharacterized protein n=1 Tax=Reticulomyxa filosa TaxID=46433 RepID=X6LNW8_RETFI|nr:hypothetical protein RFI_34096 [Reticulomyxa filosa]|eukprot:ETO03314.1 hypothetical protein RFI_34096 [Reticulomyxa filosa]